MKRRIVGLVVLVAACKPCERDCEGYIELVLVAADPMGVFGSTAYDVVVSADEDIATCRLVVDGGPASCTGDAEGMIGGFEEVDSGEDGTGGDTDAGRPVMRWPKTPTAFDVTVRDAAATLVFDNTFTPAYVDQDGESCGASCRAASLDLHLRM